VTLIVLDTETTGVAKTDQVIELCVQEGLDGPAMTWRFKPGVPISPGAQKVHGISMADLEHEHPFASYAADIAAVFSSATVLVGYNVSFDLGMLAAEFQRIGRSLDLAGKHIVDPLQLWRRMEPRDLPAAHQRFVGRPHEGAHQATADVAATGRVLLGMLRAWAIDDDWTALADRCNPERATWVGPTHHLRWDGDRIVLAFGKHSGTPVHELDPGYVRWLAGADFPDHVVQICRRARDPGLVEWARETYRRAA
jgi:DNA polymerase-3 subunit epsilon